MIDPADSAFFRFDASDEAMHEPGEEAQWNESLLFHMVEKEGARGLMLRVGRRVNEGHAEVTVTQLFPDGSIAVKILRDPISDNLAPAAGGLEFIMIEPLKSWRCRFRGEVSILADGRALKDPRCLKDAPKQYCEIDLRYDDIVPIFGAAPHGSYVSATTINRRHYEGISKVKGTVRLGSETVELDGFGFRDHSWGVRNWHSIDYWRWCYGQKDADNLFSAYVLQAGGASQVSGIIVRDGKVEIVHDLTTRSSYSDGPDHYLERIDIMISARGGPFRATLTSVCKMPLRNRKKEQVFRMVENLATVAADDWQGFGWIEAADAIVDGMPVGNRAA